MPNSPSQDETKIEMKEMLNENELLCSYKYKCDLLNIYLDKKFYFYYCHTRHFTLWHIF